MRDHYNRLINYLRISVTDRCNLRCTYCMPSESMQFLPRSEILSYEELISLINIFADLGINKLRFTGGEPFVRKDFIYFLREVTKINGINQIHITTNGVLAGKYLEELKELRISGLNISLDTIDPDTFKRISLRDNLIDVIETIKSGLQLEIPLKINMVVMEHINHHEIFPMIDYFKNQPIELRFIEFMPFNERGDHLIEWTAAKIYDFISGKMKLLPLTNPKNSTSINYQLDGFPLKLGIIAGYSRSFCGSCNRIRLNATGEMKTCLYGESNLNLRNELRMGKTTESIKESILKQVAAKSKNGFEAEKLRNSSILESMSKIGG